MTSEIYLNVIIIIIIIWMVSAIQFVSIELQWDLEDK